MNGQGNNDDSTMMWVIIGFIFIFIGFYLFNKHFDSIAYAWRFLKIIELYAFSWMPNWVPVYGNLQIYDQLEYLKTTSYGDISKEFIIQSDNFYSPYFSFIPASILGYLAFTLIKKSDNVSRTYDMETLLIDRAPLYPFLETFLTCRPEKMESVFIRGSKESKAFAMSISPGMFATMNPPIGLEKEARKNKLLRKPIWDGNMDFDSDLAERTFISQLGKPFRGLNKLNSTESRLYNDLKNKIKSTLDENYDFLLLIIKESAKKCKTKKYKKGSDLADELMANKVFVTDNEIEGNNKKILYLCCDFFILKIKKMRLEDTIKKPFLVLLYKDNSIRKLLDIRKAEMIMNRHAFIRTGLMSLLEEARNSGVVPSLEYRGWLKAEDRILWYCISSVGRRVSFVESAGCFSHWLLEKELKRPVTHPFVDEACEGLYIALRIPDREKLQRQKKRTGDL